MSSDQASAAVLAEPIGPGIFVAIVGPSGAGKDTVMRLAATDLATADLVIFARRVITRQSDGSEDHASTTPAAFGARQSAGEFVLSWEAHGLAYGIPFTELDVVRRGGVLVCNLSRAVVKEARRVFADVRVVVVTASPANLAARLVARGRDPSPAERLRRNAPDFGPIDLTIENDGTAEDAAGHLIGFLQGLVRLGIAKNAAINPTV